MMMTRHEKKMRMQSAMVTLVSLGVVGSLYLELQRQLSQRSSHSGERSVVATLKMRVKSVQRKYDHEVLWDPVSLSEPLYNRDAIRTDSESEARIQFDDGTELELAENSLVVLDRSDEKIGIQFLKGSVFAKSSGGKGSSQLEIQTKDGKVKVGDGSEKGALSLRSGEKGLEVTVAQGTAQLQTDKGSAALAVNERGQISDEGLKKEKITILLKAPVESTRFVTTSVLQPVSFEWSSEGSAPSTIQVSEDADFKKIIFEGNAGKKTAALDPGSYYWRVKAKSELSEVRKFRVIRHKPARLEAPFDNALFSSFKNQKDVRMEWGSSAVLSGAVDRVELATDSQFRHKVSVGDLINQPSTVKNESRFYSIADNLPSGEYYWRVVSRYDRVGPMGIQTAEIPSLVRKFTKRNLDRLPAPELLTPAPNAALGVNDQKKNVRFTWRPVEEAFGYRLLVSSYPDFEKLIVNTFTPSSSWEGEVDTTGAVYWTVQSVAQRAPSSDDSISAVHRKLSINREGGFRLFTPKTTDHFEYLDDKPDLTFSWDSYSGAKKYEIQISSDPAFTGVAYKKLLSASQSAKTSVFKLSEPPSGDLYWRVRALDDSAQTMALSEVGQYHLKQKPALNAPDKILPDPQFKQELDARTGDEVTVKFQWKPVQDAKEYKFTIWKLSNTKKYEIHYQKTLSKTEIERDLDEGSYQWDVRAVDAISRAGEAGALRFVELRQSGKLPAPILESPANQAVIEDTEIKKITLKWNKVEGAKKYKVVVYRLGNDGSRSVIKSTETEDLKLTLPDSLKSNHYVWEVTGIGALPGRTSGSQFTLRWVGILEAPTKIKVRVEVDRLPAEEETGTSKEKSR